MKKWHINGIKLRYTKVSILRANMIRFQQGEANYHACKRSADKQFPIKLFRGKYGHRIFIKTHTKMKTSPVNKIHAGEGIRASRLYQRWWELFMLQRLKQVMNEDKRR
jgi:hypothetical protein